ncbi:MAG: YdcF family protein [Bacteroidetes bacterium HGW-Bacteroidetes-6]|jgi:vancomycin permeability regulator SanA|nr:MAG: YdcF family protein [Bacteroidetes bacterium HGW-Bacteroidetes-6]
MRLKHIIRLLLLWFLIHETIIIVDGLRDEKVNCEAAIIFGTTVNADGTLSTRLQARLDAGIELYNNKVVRKLFVSGGLGKEGFDEGTKMAEYLVSKGVSESDIIVDNNGNNTRETAENFVKQFPECESVIVVSQYFHISRAKLALRKVGVKNVYGVHAPIFEWRDLFSLGREFFAYYKYLIF